MMHSIARFALIAAVLLAVPASAEESDGAPSAAPKVVTVGVEIVGFHPVSDVKKHADSVEDVQALIEAGKDYAAVEKVYTAGAGTHGKNLQSFSTKFAAKATMQAEPVATELNAFWGQYDYADKMILAAIQGTDAGRLGNYKSAELAKTDDARKQIIKKGAAFSSVWLYALHEMEAALVKYAAGNYDVAKGAPHALDEAWAFWAGSAEIVGGAGPYGVAEKWSKYFGTYGYSMGNGGGSRVNLEVLYHLTAMQRYLQTPGNSESLQDAAKCVRAQFKVPIIQGCLKYGFQASSAEMTKDDDLSKTKAEAWAFCVGALAFLNDVDSVAAQNAEAEVTLNTNARPNWDVVKKAFSTSNLNKMGISCLDVGVIGGGGIESARYKDLKSQPYVSGDEQLSWCKDDEKVMQANPNTDTTRCKYTRMPDCSKDIVCSVSSGLQASSAVFVSIVALCSYMFAGLV